MHCSGHNTLKAFACLYFCLLPGLAAEPVYKWEGADGGIHYSGSPPAGDDHLRMEVIELPPYVETPAAAGDYRAILEVADSLQAARLQREQLRLQRRQFALEREQLRQQRRETDTPARFLTPFALPQRFPLHPHRGKGSHPRPEQPRVRHEREPPRTGRVIVGR